MTGEEEKARIIKECMNNALYNGCGSRMMVAAVFVVVILFTSCATRTQIEYRDRIVDHYITNVVHDTLIDKTTDSVYFEVKVKGDTVFQTKYREKTRWRDRIVERRDTCWRDSVVKECTETVKTVVKYPKTYWWFLGFTILFFIFAFVKLKRWLRIIT